MKDLQVVWSQQPCLFQDESHILTFISTGPGIRHPFCIQSFPLVVVRHLGYFWLSAAEVSHLAIGISVGMDLWKSLFLITAVGIHPRRGTWVSCVRQLS